MTDKEIDESERRQAFRLDMEKELVDLVWTDDTGHEHQIKIACRDFSRGGLKIDCYQAIAVQTAVTVIFKAASPNNQRLYAKVIRCLKQDNGWYEIALQLNDGV